MGALDAISLEAREVLLEALMSVAWADRTLADEEKRAAQAAAMGLGLVLPGDSDPTSVERRSTPPESLPTDRLVTRDRELIYLCSAWMALADDIEVPQETRVLERLAARFEIDDDRSAWLRERAYELKQQQPPSISAWRAFDRLVVEAAKALQKTDSR